MSRQQLDELLQIFVPQMMNPTDVDDPLTFSSGATMTFALVILSTVCQQQ